MTDETDEIATAIAAFQAEMPTVAKSRTAKVPTKAGGEYSYTYAGLADVAEIAFPLLTSHGLSFVACPRRTDAGHYELAGVLLHTSGQRLEGVLPLQGGRAQEIGSAITYARRYLLGCMTGLVTDDDDDGQLAKRAERLASTPEDDPWYGSPGTGSRQISADQVTEIVALQQRGGITSQTAAIAQLSRILRRSLGSINDLTREDAERVLTELKTPPAGGSPHAPTPAGGPEQGTGGETSEGEAGEAPSVPDETDPGPAAASDVDSPRGPRLASRAQQRMLLAMLGGLGVDTGDRAERLLIVGTLAGRSIGSFTDLTSSDAKRAIDAITPLEGDPAKLTALLDTLDAHPPTEESSGE